MPAYACVASLRSTLHVGECTVGSRCILARTAPWAQLHRASAGCVLTQLRGEELSYTTLLLCPKNKQPYTIMNYKLE